jgi:uncharacterized membrane protein (UPF0127 family)
MRKQEIGLVIGRRKLNIEVYKVPWYLGWKGLMFKAKKKARALVFDFFKKDIKIRFHSFFVFFEFYILWLDRDNKVLEYRKVGPFNPGIMPSVKFRKVVEIPINSNYEEVLKILVEERKI